MPEFSFGINKEANISCTTPEGKKAVKPLGECVKHLSPRILDTADFILPDGTKAMVPARNGVILVHQTPPMVFNFKWIHPKSTRNYGDGTKYRQVRISLPYIILVAEFYRKPGNSLILGNNNEAFFRNEPLGSLDDNLCYPALLNCSRFSSDYENPKHKAKHRSWVCTQHLQSSRKGRTLYMGLDALIWHLFETGFNLSSDFHECESWFTASARELDDPRIKTVEAWQKATTKEPNFARTVDWIPAPISLRQVINNYFRRGEMKDRLAVSAVDLARAVFREKKK